AAVVREGQRRQVVLAEGVQVRVALVPAEARQRGHLLVVLRRLEVGEAEVAVLVRADEQQVLALPGGQAGVAAARRDEAAQDLPEGARGTGEAAAGREVVLTGELQQEDAPRLPVPQRLDLPDVPGN